MLFRKTPTKDDHNYVDILATGDNYSVVDPASNITMHVVQMLHFFEVHMNSETGVSNV